MIHLTGPRDSRAAADGVAAELPATAAERVAPRRLAVTVMADVRRPR